MNEDQIQHYWLNDDKKWAIVSVDSDDTVRVHYPLLAEMLEQLGYVEKDTTT